MAVKKWVTYHGAALNVYRDLLAFQGLNPCGFPSKKMTCMENLTTLPLERERINEQLSNCLYKTLRERVI
ncbi:hypothetical protein OAQ84_01925 [Bdellovibrionales bacterium]|nr:hypothetical protein [Bdellovibrionales bacterium]